MKIVIIVLSALLISSCASTSKVNDIEQLVTDGQTTIATLDDKIELLENDRKQLTSQLSKLDSDGQSAVVEAKSIRAKITTIDKSITTYQKQIKSINSSVSKNSKNLTEVHKAAASAVKDNEALKIKAVDDIKALEREYEERRRKAKDQNNKEQDNKEPSR